MLCGQILVFLQKHILAYSWLLLQYVHCPWLQTGKNKPDSHSTFLWCVWIWHSWSCSLWKSIFLHFLCISLQELKRSNGCVPVWPEVHHWSRALSKVCLLVFHKWTLYFPNTYTDPEIQALTRLSRERGVRKRCFTSPNVGWIQCENSKLVKSTWNRIHPFYFS